ncbi:MAG: hypothetical protein WC863_03205 [Patescibacteria group bacterium]
MPEYKIYLGIVSSLVASLAYIPYLRDIFKGKTKPHIFSWFLWGLLGAITFLAQIVKGAGPGAWSNGLTALICFVIVALSFNRWERKMFLFDWLTLIGALLGLGLWGLTDDPLWAVILATLVDALAYSWTFRKAYREPYEETMVYFILAMTGTVISLFALETYNLVTWLYPGSLVVSNSFFIMMLFIRRKILISQKI